MKSGSPITYPNIVAPENLVAVSSPYIIAWSTLILFRMPPPKSSSYNLFFSSNILRPLFLSSVSSTLISVPNILIYFLKFSPLGSFIIYLAANVSRPKFLFLTGRVWLSPIPTTIFSSKRSTCALTYPSLVSNAPRLIGFN